ncbi:ABC transporter substrate-binding protein [Paenibacillaceae bacterium WGS1546]|uniref:ABC transporter substrate-binding protein n=1 Tax=Cohnella sp. WGS1546 TaxID=3366810 RepID=UPI00372D2653
MKLRQQFLQLHTLAAGADRVETTLDEIGRELECTPRNAANVIRAMSRNGWVTWSSSRGRGRRSTLVFLAQPEDIAVQSVLQAIDRKGVARAIGQLKLHRRSSALQEHLQGWLLSYFGHHAETSSDRQIDTLRIPIRQPLQTVDPLYMNLLAESFVSSHVFDGLVRRSDRGDGIAPGIAHAWETDEARSSWTFYLRKEILFHHGKVLTAEDVVFTFDRLIRSPRRTLYSLIYKRIKSVRALNPTVVRFELEEPNELFLPFLCTSRAAIVPKDLSRIGSARFGTEPVGTGPFKVAEMNEAVCVMEAFGSYFQGRAHLDRVEIVHVPWASEEKGGGHAEVSPFHVIPNASSRVAEWSRIHSETTIRKFVTCNTQKPGPLTDPAVREHVFRCLGGDSPNAPMPARATVPLRIATISPYSADAAEAAAKLGSFGYACEVLAVSPEEFKGAIRLESDLILFSLLRDRDEQLRLYDLYMTISGHVDAHTRIDIGQLLARVRKEPDAEARGRDLDRIERLLIAERQLHILSEKPIPTAYVPFVRGLTFNSQGWVNLRTIWFPPDLAK